MYVESATKLPASVCAWARGGSEVSQVPADRRWWGIGGGGGGGAIQFMANDSAVLVWEACITPTICCSQT